MNDDQELTPDERVLLDALAHLPPLEPREDLGERFRARAALEHPGAGTARRWVPIAIAASLVLAMVGGWWLERQRREMEVEQLRAELALALEDLSAVTRMQGIVNAGRSGAHDDRVADALIDALLGDPNTNVRVAAAEALATVGFPGAFVRAARLSFATERSPFVQSALLDATSRLSPAARVPLLRILLARPDLDSGLRTRVVTQSSL